MQIPYNPTWRALLHPAVGAAFFPEGRPADEAALCAELSRLAYVEFEKGGEALRAAEAALAGVGFTDARFFSARGTECFLARDPAAALTVLAFRGTAGPRDLLTDILAWRQRWSAGGAVHHGFAKALGVVWPQLLPYLGKRAGRLVYTGHSLGAALATLAASLVAPDLLYTFGSPRVGNARFVDALAGLACRRTIDCTDLVCQVPPSWLGYVHAGSDQYVDRDGRLLQNLPASAVRADQARGRSDYRRRFAWRPGNVWSRRLADHSPINYVSAMGRRVPL